MGQVQSLGYWTKGRAFGPRASLDRWHQLAWQATSQVWINSCISHLKAQLAQLFLIQHLICTYWIKGILCGYAIRPGRHPRPSVGLATADFSRDVCLTISHNHKVFPLDHLETNEIQSSSVFSIMVMTWWSHQMETFSALLALSACNSPITGVFPSQRPVTRSFDVFFIFAWTLWCQCNEISYTWQNTRPREIKKGCTQSFQGPISI